MFSEALIEFYSAYNQLTKKRPPGALIDFSAICSQNKNKTKPEVRAKYKLIARILKEINTRIKPLLDTLSSLSESEIALIGPGGEVDIKLTQFLEDLSSTLQNLARKDSTLTHHSDKYAEVTAAFIDLFQCAYLVRLEKINCMIIDQLKNNTDKEKSLTQLLKQLHDHSTTLKQYSSVHLPLLFSQSSCNSLFSDKGNPATQRKPVLQVTGELKEEQISPDHLPLSVYVGVGLNDHEGCSIFAINNRTFFALSAAERSPSRPVPVLPTTEESKRINILRSENSSGDLITLEDTEAMLNSPPVSPVGCWLK